MRGFGYTVSESLLIQVYGIKVSCFFWIFDIQSRDVLNVYFSVEEALLAGYFYNFEEFWYLMGKKEICNKIVRKMVD